MIIIKNRMMIMKMEKAGELLSAIMNDIKTLIIPGVSTHDIDQWVMQQLKCKGLVSAMKGYAGYQHVTCISLNDVVVHGVPSKSIILKAGDLVKVDVCASWKGYCADMARCFFVKGDSIIDVKAQQLVAVAQSALDKGIEQCIIGNKLGDISYAIQQEIEKHGFGIIRDFAGHGIGKSMHEDPEILNYGNKNEGVVLREGMAFAIEPMITVGSHDVYITDDEWTVKTKDGSWAAHVEDTVIITAQGPKIITRCENKGEVRKNYE